MKNRIGSETRRLAGLSLAVFMLTGVPFQLYSQSEQLVAGKIWVSVSENLSLFHILVLLTPSRFERTDLFPHPLAAAARESFKEFRSHPAVAMTDKFFRESWYFLFDYAAYLYTDFPEARLLDGVILPDEFAANEPLKKTMEEYLDLVRDFYAASKFAEFWEQQKAALEALVATTRGGLAQDVESPSNPKVKYPRADLPRLMEEFYGTRGAARYDFVPCPFMQFSATHAEVGFADGSPRFYYLQGGDIGRNWFYQYYFAFHEFGHSFVGPLSAKYANQINALSHLFAPMRADLAKIGYGAWPTAFEEHVVRAGVLHLLRKAFGEEEMRAIWKVEEPPSFRLLDRFYAYLQDYDAQRDRHRSLEAFFPELLERLGRLEIESYRRPDRMGFYSEYKDNRLFIKDLVPDSAFAKAGVQKGDTLVSIQGDKVTSAEDFNRVKEARWNSVKEGDSVEVVLLRESREIKLKIPVPFVTDFRYIEK